jgi:endonuclease/exonuclease/phosphatase family metal-dependent hydrolase
MKRKKSSFFQKVVLFLNVLTIICLLLAYLCSVTNPQNSWYFTFFGLAYPFILLSNFLFVIYWIVFKRWYFLASLIVILAGWSILTKTIGFRTASASNFTESENTLKIMSYNVHHFKKFGSELEAETSSNILRFIESENPDVLGLEEFFTRKKGKYNFKDSILNILNTKHYYYDTALNNDYESTGVAIFSKFPIIGKGDLEIENQDNGNKAIWVDIKKGTQTIRVYVVHLASISLQAEDYSFINEVKADLNTSNDVGSSKRILRKLKNAFIKRSKEVEVLQNAINQTEFPVIVMGDFNDTPSSYCVNTIGRSLKNSFQEKGSGLGITYNGDAPNFQIDYVFTSPTFNIDGYKIIKKEFSDHYPIRVNVTLPQY